MSAEPPSAADSRRPVKHLARGTLMGLLGGGLVAGGACGPWQRLQLSPEWATAVLINHSRATLPIHKEHPPYVPPLEDSFLDQCVGSRAEESLLRGLCDVRRRGLAVSGGLIAFRTHVRQGRAREPARLAVPDAGRAQAMPDPTAGLPSPSGKNPVAPRPSG